MVTAADLSTINDLLLPQLLWRWEKLPLRRRALAFRFSKNFTDLAQATRVRLKRSRGMVLL